MKWTQLKQDIEDKTARGVYVLHGDEEYLKDYAINRCKNLFVDKSLEDLNVNVFDNPLFKDILFAGSTPPFMAEKRVIIVRNYKGFYDKTQNAAKQKSEELDSLINNISPDCCVFFLCRGRIPTANALLKIAKKHKRDVSYTNIKDDEKIKMISDIADELNMTLDRYTASFLLNYTNASLIEIENELKKLQSFTDKKITINDIESICHASTSYTVFTMINAINNKQTGKALIIFRDMIKGGEYLGAILSMLERQYRTYAYIDDIKKEYEGKKIDYEKIAQSLNTKAFVVKKMYAGGLRLTKQKRDMIIQKSADADYQNKRGYINEEDAVEKLIMELCC